MEIEITLRINNEPVRFVNDFVTARHYIDARALYKAIEANTLTDEEVLEKMTEYVIEVFENQFTIDQLWGGINSKDFNRTLTDIILKVLRGGA